MSNLELLKIEYLEKVNIINNKSRNAILFTDLSKEDVMKTFSKRKVDLIQVLEENVISIKFSSAIEPKTLNALFQYCILYSSFKKNENVAINENDKRDKYYNNYMKKVFEDNGIDVNELQKLTKQQFYDFYPQETLSQKFIGLVNAYYTKKMLNDMKHDFDDVEWHPFQKSILNICKNKPDKRAIYIIEDVDKIKNGEILKSGNIGKSYVCDKLDLDYNVIIADGKKDNIFNQIKTHMDKGNMPNVIILDIPRQGKDYINYGALEQIKNGLIYSGKYEGGKCRYPSPHMFLLSNFRVDISQWSQDRIRFIDTTTGMISKQRIPNEDGVSDYFEDDRCSQEELSIDYKTMYYELEIKYSKLKEEYEESKKK